MADFPTRTDLFDAGAREIIARSAVRAPAKRISSQALYTEGTDVNIIVAGGSAMAEDVLRQHAKDVADLFLDSASGDALDRLVTDRYGREVVRKEAAPALVTLELTRSAGGFPAGSLSAGDRVRTGAGLEFELRTAVSIGAGVAGPVSVTARSVLAGASSNAAADSITEFLNPPFDTNLRVTNPVTATGGADRETDAAYRGRARLFFTAARRAIKAAIEFGALTVPGVALASAEEELDNLGTPTGNVFVYVADVNGQANAVLTQKVRDALIEYRALGIPPFVIGAVPEYVPITYRLRFVSGVDQALAFEQVRFGTVALVNQTLPNSPLEVSLLFALARRVPGVIVRSDALVTPVGDVYPSVSGRIIRTTSALVTLASS